jgi:hypothetical protein
VRTTGCPLTNTTITNCLSFSGTPEHSCSWGTIHFASFPRGASQIQELAVRDSWHEYPRHMVALMFASDVTHPTSFGMAYLQPCYMYFGNESKYRRSQPSCRSCSHIAYFQKVPFCCSHLHHVCPMFVRKFFMPNGLSFG